MTVAYIDASALTKLVLDEPDSPAFRRWYVEADRVLCSRVGIVETRRAASRQPHDAGQLDAILSSVEVIEFDRSISQAAGSVPPVALKTLDAIHLSSALALIGSLDAFVTYDQRLAAAARVAGLPVVSPAA